MSGWTRLTLTLLTATGLVSSGCRPKTPGAKAKAEDTSPFAGIALGAAFDPSTGTYKEPCLQGTQQLVGGSTQSLTSTYGFSQTDSVVETSGAYTVNADLGILGAGRDDEGVHRVAKTSQTLNITRVFSADLGSITLEERAYNDRGKAAASAGASAGSPCGSAFAYRKRLGTRLYLSAQIEFNSVDTLNRFVSKYTVSAFFGLFKKTITLPPIQWEDFHGQGYLVVSGTQSGGDEQAFKTLIGGLNKQPCPLGKLAGCLAAMQSLMTYATGTATGGYLSQFQTFSAGTWQPDSGDLGPAVIGIEPRGYGESGHVELAPSAQDAPDPAIFLLINDLRQALADQWSIKTRIDFLLSIDDVEAAKKNQLQNQLGPAVAKNIQTLTAALNQCQAPNQRSQCLQNGRGVLGDLPQPSDDQLNF